MQYSLTNLAMYLTIIAILALPVAVISNKGALYKNIYFIFTMVLLLSSAILAYMAKEWNFSEW